VPGVTPERVERDEELLVEVRIGAVQEGVEVVGEKRKKKSKGGKDKGKGVGSLGGDGMEEDEEEGLLGPFGVDAAFVETDEKLVTKLVRVGGWAWVAKMVWGNGSGFFRVHLE